MAVRAIYRSAIQVYLCNLEVGVLVTGAGRIAEDQLCGERIRGRAFVGRD